MHYINGARSPASTDSLARVGRFRPAYANLQKTNNDARTNEERITLLLEEDIDEEVPLMTYREGMPELN
jgi:hypothetical protein